MKIPQAILEDLTHHVEAQMGWPDGGASGMREWLGVPTPRSARASYDLTSERYDLPQGLTQRSIVIASDYRTGSTLLAEGLAGAGGFGVPLEYLQRGAMEWKFSRFAAPTPEEYLSKVMGRRTSQSGVFGIKLFWPESSFLNTLPQPTVIWLRRDDVIAQAVSTWTALISDVWRSSSLTECNIPYDRERLTALVGMHIHHANSWKRMLANQEVMTLTYEKLSSDPVGVTEAIVAELAERGMAAESQVPSPRLTRQAERRSKQLIDRLAEDILTEQWKAPREL